MSNDVVAFGSLYLDIITDPVIESRARRPNVLYGKERTLDDYDILDDGIFLKTLYEGRHLQITTSGGVENGSLRLIVGGEETGCTYHTTIGGSTANFAVQLKLLGLNPLLIGKIGKDMYGDRLRILLQGTCEYHPLETNAKQTLSINIVNPETKEAAMIVSGGSNRDLKPEEIDEQLQLGTPQFLYAGGFFKMRQLFPYYPEIFRRARERGCRVVLDHGRFLDTSGSSEYQEVLKVVKDALQHVDVYLPNETEITELTGKSNLEGALKEVTQELGTKLIVCKRGANGCSFITDSQVYHVPQGHTTEQILHTVGAGDSFNAGLIKGLIENSDVERAARLGNASAYLKITMGGYPTYSDVIQLLI